MGPKVYIDGKLCEKADAKISVYDHGLLYGDGVFEGIRVYGARIFRCKEHVDRLYESACAIALRIPMTKEEIVAAMEATVAANGIKDGYIRLVVTRGVGTLGLDPNKCPHPSVIVIADTIQLYPQEFYEKGLHVITVPTIRNHPEAINPRIKSLNYLNNIMAKIEAINGGTVEAIMLNKDGYVAECTGDNIFIVKNRKLLTPPASAGVLKGITRAVVMDLAAGIGVPVLEPNLTRYDLFTADECFLTGTAAEIVPVVNIDGRIIGDGKPGTLTLELLELFRAETRKQ
ncbi:MAG TPA: branched-chain-amino-acid transaminase [Candidatus Brocadiia bacterium]|nr:branched-chain-amino-acid transaminase [Candidatus Brocadiia bacterium]